MRTLVHGCPTDFFGSINISPIIYEKFNYFQVSLTTGQVKRSSLLESMQLAI